MSTNVFQPACQATTSQQDLRTRVERSLTACGKPADKETVERVLNGTPVPTDVVKGNLPNRAFNLMR